MDAYRDPSQPVSLRVGILLSRMTLEEKLADVARSQVGYQIVKGTVFLSLGATAVGFAARGEPLDTRGPQQIGRHGQLTQQVRLALAQGQGGSALEPVYLSHLRG